MNTRHNLKATQGTTVPAALPQDEMYLDRNGRRLYIDSRSGLADIAFQNVNDIGTPGAQGFGVGICPELPAGFTEFEGTRTLGAATYGNYVYRDGSVMVWVPKFYYKIGTSANGLTVNAIDIKGERHFPSRDIAEAYGYALHRAFIDGGAIKRGVMVDKYQCSANAWGTGTIASSIKSGAPISTHATHNPISGLTACSADAYHEVVAAAHARDGVNGAVNATSIFFCNTRFVWASLAMISLAHGQAADGTIHCAWYDTTGATNYAKGNNNNALGDTDDSDILYVTDGFGTADSGLTGSGTPFARTTHNGQPCGIADLNGNMWEVTIGITRPGASATDSTNQNDADDFYVLKEGVAAASLTSGWNTGVDAWGDAAHLASLYDQITIAHIANSGIASKYGSGSNQVLSDAISGDGYKLAGLGLPKDANASDATGANEFGLDYFYEYHRANLALLSGGGWDNAALAGVWAANFSDYRTRTSAGVGFRCACYPV